MREVTFIAIALLNSMIAGVVSAEAPKNETIAFSTNHGADSGIWLMDPDGNNQRALLAIEGNPIPLGLVWSSDGSRIAFHTEINENIDVYVVDADGQNLRQLTNHEAEDSWPSWHPGGQKIAFCTNRDGNFEIYMMASGGQGLVNLTNDTAKDREPAWSPDARKIAFASKRGKSLGDIWVMDNNGGNLQNVTDVRGQDTEPRWSWDGQKIGWTSRRNGNDEIWIMDGADGGNLLKITDLKDNSDPNREPTWKPNGKNIASPALGGGSATIRIHPTDGSLKWNNLQRAGTQNRSPAWFDPDFVEAFSVAPAQKQALTWGWIKQMGRGD
jgi:Tol biopolymer transport system component